MMVMNKNISNRIESLLLKTVANGASPEEALSAKKMAEKLQAKYGIEVKVFTQKANSSGIKAKQNVKRDKDHLDLFNRCVDMDNLHQHIHDIDWDVIAENILPYHLYTIYLEKTHSFWVSKESYKNNISFENVTPISERQYRENVIECSGV